MKPTILAFHGSGSSAMVHTVQLARLLRAIGSDFHVESLDAPFPSQAGPGVLPFFDGCGPFKRWIDFTVSPSESKEGTSTNALPTEVEELVRSTVRRIQSTGGKVVGLIGFSQGTRVVAGLLKSAQLVHALRAKGEAVDGLDWCDWAFGVSVCGSYPPPLIAPSVQSALKASKLSDQEQKELVAAKISTPTFHVQGSQDEFRWAGQLLIEQCYDVGEGKSTVREYDIGHYYPVQQENTDEIAEWLGEVSKGEQA